MVSLKSPPSVMLTQNFSYIRSMNELDLPWVNQTESLAYAFPWREQGFVKVLDDGLCYVFCDEQDQLMGYACFQTILDELHLLNFCIAPNFQGRGLGGQTLLSLLERFVDSQYSVVFLEVRTSNSAAKHLYQKLGFKVDGVRANYYRCENSKEDAILMSYHY